MQLAPNNNIDFAPFTTQSVTQITELVDVNIRFLTYLTRYMHRLLTANARENGGRSMILNISSLADIGMPYLAAYSASKAFLTAFTKALDTEMKAEG